MFLWQTLFVTFFLFLFHFDLLQELFRVMGNFLHFLGIFNEFGPFSLKNSKAIHSGNIANSIRSSEQIAEWLEGWEKKLQWGEFKGSYNQSKPHRYLGIFFLGHRHLGTSDSKPYYFSKISYFNPGCSKLFAHSDWYNWLSLTKHSRTLTKFLS